MMGEEKNLLRDFVIGCLKGENEDAGYMHFKVAGILPIQNLLENLKRQDAAIRNLSRRSGLIRLHIFLRNTAMSVMDISMSVGYDNTSYFHRIFQKPYGMTPGKYRISK